MNHRQPRTYPLIGLLLANLLTNVVIAKLAPLSAAHLSHESDPWLAYNRPTHEEYHQSQYPSSAYWNPVHQPLTYGPPPLHTTVSITTPNPIAQQQIVNINGYLPDYNNDYYQDTAAENEQPEQKFQSLPETYQDNIPAGSNKTFSIIEPSASGTNLNAKRQKPSSPPNKSHTKRATYGPKYSGNRALPNRVVTVRYKRYKTSQRKRFTTTPSYYDSYEEFTTTRYRPRKRIRPTYNYRRTTTPVYDDYEEEEEEESFEATTRPYRRKRPIKTKNKRRPVYEHDDYSYDASYEYDDRRPITETVTFRQRQGVTTTTEAQTESETESTTPTSTTTMSTNTTSTANPTNTTSNSSLYPGQNNNNNISITYTRPGNNDYLYPTFTGYGPSNGNENISITYGPPTRLEYAAPYLSWYTPQSRTNEIVGRVHDIVGFDNRDLFRRRLT